MAYFLQLLLRFCSVEIPFDKETSSIESLVSPTFAGPRNIEVYFADNQEELLLSPLLPGAAVHLVSRQESTSFVLMKNETLLNLKHPGPVFDIDCTRLPSTVSTLEG